MWTFHANCLLICMKCPSLFSASVAQLDAPSDWRPGGHGFNPRRGRQHSFVEIDHEIFSTVILSLPLIQEGQKSIFWEIQPAPFSLIRVRLMIRSCGIDFCRVWQQSSMEIYNEIISKIIVYLLLILKGQLSVSGERRYGLTTWRTKPVQEKCG